MTIFISGGAKSGKSSLAQKAAVSLARGKQLYYVATLLSSGEEDDARIRRHIADRAGMGFQTVECYKYVMECFQAAERDGTFLVDSLTSLMQNALFPAEQGYALDEAAGARCADQILSFAKAAGNAVFVSDNIYADGIRYPETTEFYRACLARLDRRLAAACDTVVEVVGGQPIVYKGELRL